MIHYSKPPILLEGLMQDPSAVVRLLERHAPYTPLGGWYRPGVDLDSPTSPMWFQNDWVHDGTELAGSDLFLRNELVKQAARDFYGAEVVAPHSVYVNIMAAMDTAGPAHTDNPRFQGRDRSNTPMWLLRNMLWSGLFERWSITQATSIWWMHDTEGGAFLYWPGGPDKPPQEHYGAMENTALVGDNHGMFHQVGPVGPFGMQPNLVSSRAELSPVGDGSGDWSIHDQGSEFYRAPLGSYRVSVLWKADIYRDEAEQAQQMADLLSMQDVVDVYNADLAAKGVEVRMDLERIEEPGLVAAVQAVYPEAIPTGKLRSLYDA